MKRLVAILAACTMLVCAAASCGSSSSGGGSSAKSSASSDELSGKYKLCSKNGDITEVHALLKAEFEGNNFTILFSQSGVSAEYAKGTFEIADDKITLNPVKATKEEAAVLNGMSVDDYPDSSYNEFNDRIQKWFSGTFDYNVFDGNTLYLSAIDSLVQEVEDYDNDSKQRKANSACSSICKAVALAYMDAEAAGKLPARNKKKQPVIYSSDASKTINCDGLNDVLHAGIVNYFKDADKYDYIVAIDDRGDYVFGACCEKGGKYVGLMTGIYKDTDFTGMTLDEIYEVVSK